ncbi:MAG: hypothetical protein B5M56_02950 [Desulfococcus sp. 4484_241]|nr:MAG: hypothetical protein B5M56_02950 [Desulfococcus sp. 4484_241]
MEWEAVFFVPRMARGWGQAGAAQKLKKAVLEKLFIVLFFCLPKRKEPKEKDTRQLGLRLHLRCM